MADEDLQKKREIGLMKQAWDEGFRAGQDQVWQSNPYDTANSAAGQPEAMPSNSSKQSSGAKKQRTENFLAELHDRRFESCVRDQGCGYQLWLGPKKLRGGWLWFDSDDQAKIKRLVRKGGGSFNSENEDWVIVIGKLTLDQFNNCEKPEGFTFDEFTGFQRNVKSGTTRAIRDMEYISNPSSASASMSHPTTRR